MLRREFAGAASVSASEFLTADSVDGVCFVFGIDEARTIVDMVDFVDVVDTGCVDVVFQSAILIEVMVGCFRCFGG